MEGYTYAAIVLAGGRGKRMNSDIPKQYLMLEDKPILYYTLKAFQESSIDAIVLVTGKEELEYCKEEIVNRYGFDKVQYIVEGGAERYNSVYNGLKCVQSYDFVLIHDGARPFVSRDVIEENMRQVVKKNACVTGVQSKDTVKIADENGIIKNTPERKNVWIIQTPQTFSVEVITKAYEMILKEENISVTDDAMVVEAALDIPVYLIQGDYRNIKITTPEDIELAKHYLKYVGKFG